MKNQLAILGLFVISISCSRNANAPDQDAIPSKPNAKVERIKNIMNEVGFLKLPYRANYDTSTSSNYRIMWDADSAIRGDFTKGEAYVAGVIPDTSNFFAILYTAVGAVGNQCLITFDKQGRKIDEKLLTDDQCLLYTYGGDVLLCKEYTLINPDLTLQYFHKSIVVYERGLDNYDTLCSQTSKSGALLTDGQIILGDLIKSQCQ